MEKKKHHHGNLRGALVNAGLELMEAGGPDALTLRKCAARAGVSHAAPAYHFSGLISLKAAIVAHGFKVFTKTMQEHRAKAGQTPRARLLAICQGYLAFATAHGALFRFMFQDFNEVLNQIDKAVLAEVRVESTAAYAELHEACTPFGGQGQGIDVIVWSLVHGYAMLFSGGSKNETPAGPVPDFADILPEFPLRQSETR